jgi:hypothetical protein
MIVAFIIVAISGIPASGIIVWQASEAAFSGTNANPSNSWAAGSVTLTDDDGGTAMFTASGLIPGSTGSKCIKVTYGGNVSSGDVRIYSAAPTGALGGFITMTVEMGPVAGSGTFSSCAGFAMAATPVNNVLLSTIGTKADYSAGYSTGWNPSASQSRVFRFTYTVSGSLPDSQQGATCTIPFTWETQVS